jgi:hypothetical protein
MANLSELKKALTSSTDGAALVPYDLDPILHEELLRLQPLTQLLATLQAEGKTHEYSVRTSHPQAWFEGETAKSDDVNSVYARKSVQLKIQRLWGSVTGFAQAVDERFVNALETELRGGVQGMADAIEYGALFGTAADLSFTGDSYQFSGILPILFNGASANVIDGLGQKVSLDALDAAATEVMKWRQLRVDPKLWLMSTRMKQVVDGLQTKVQLPLTSVEYGDAKLSLDAYGKAPIYETEYMAPGTGSPAAPTATVGAGGALTTGVAVRYRISSVTMYGESIGGTQSAQVTPATTNLLVNLSWSADPAARLYMIFRQDTSGDFRLIDIINAKTYDASGKINGDRTTYTDAGARAPITRVKPLETGEQQIALININPVNGAAFVGKVDDMGRPMSGLMSYVELARTRDSYDFMLKSYMALRSVYPNSHSLIRHIKVSA